MVTLCESGRNAGVRSKCRINIPHTTHDAASAATANKENGGRCLRSSMIPGHHKSHWVWANAIEPRVAPPQAQQRARWQCGICSLLPQLPSHTDRHGQRLRVPWQPKVLYSIWIYVCPTNLFYFPVLRHCSRVQLVGHVTAVALKRRLARHETVQVLGKGAKGEISQQRCTSYLAGTLPRTICFPRQHSAQTVGPGHPQVNISNPQQ